MMSKSKIKNRTITDDWEVTQDIEPCEFNPEFVLASDVVRRSYTSMQNVMAEIKGTSWPGVSDLLQNKLARAMKEVEVYMSSAFESLDRAKKAIDFLEKLENRLSGKT